MKKVMTSVFLLLLFSFAAIGQEEEAGKKLLKEYNRRMEQHMKPAQGKVCYLEMTKATYYKAEAGKKDVHLNIKIHVASGRTQYESETISYYTDEKDAIVVIHPQQAVIWSDAVTSPGTNRYTNIGLMQDTLMKHSKVSSCKDVTVEGRKQKEIILVPDKLFQEASGVAKIIYYYDLQEDRIYKGIVQYSAKSLTREEVITYRKMSFDHKQFPFSRAINAVFQTKGVLAPAYRNYELIDNRKFN